MLEGLPAEVLYHVRHTSRCAFRIVAINESSGSTLYLFQVVDISAMVGVPDSGRVFQSWAYHSGVGS